MLVDSEPTITAGKHVTCINQRPGVALTCAVRYSGSNMMPLLMTWTTSSELILTNRTYNSSLLFMSSFCLTPSLFPTSSSSSPLSSSSYTCTVIFSRPTANSIFRGNHSKYYSQKSNAPSFTVSAFYDAGESIFTRATLC